MTNTHALASAVTVHHASTARAIGRVSALLAQHRAHFTALHELVNRQAALVAGHQAHIRAALDTGGSFSAVQKLVAGHQAHASAALDGGGLRAVIAQQQAAATTSNRLASAFATGSVTAALAFARPPSHVSALRKLFDFQGAHVTAALARPPSHVSVLQNLVADPGASIRAALDPVGSVGAVRAAFTQHQAHIGAALDPGGSMGAVRTALAQQRAHLSAIHQLADIGTVGPARASLAGRRGGSTVLRVDPFPIATPYDDPEDVLHRQQRFDPEDETDAFLEQTLAKLNPAFLGQFRGSMLRSEERGPDWWTQAAASERKLFLGVLHTAAPDDRVVPWVTNRKDQLDRRGHPTRRTKIAWLCRSILNDSYRKYLIAELDSALTLIDLFSAAVHLNAFPEFETTFSWTHLRLKVAIRRMLEIWLKRS